MRSNEAPKQERMKVIFEWEIFFLFDPIPLLILRGFLKRLCIKGNAYQK